jgi:diguanylate cyclase (GGDEF)-like protein
VGKDRGLDMTKFKGIFVKSRKSIMTTNALLALGIAVIELIMYFVLKNMEGISMGNNYILMYFVMPSCINFFLCFVGNLILKYVNCTESTKNYIPIYVLSLICFGMAAIHNVFQATLCSFCIPILITVLYGNRKMTRIIFLSCLILQQVAFIISSIDARKNHKYLIMDAIVSALITFASYACSIVLIQYENQKKEMLSDSIIRQVELQEQLLTDSLTSLYNLRAFRGVLDQSVEEAEINGKEVVLAVIDIDNFKKINDEYGHEEGNVVLIKLGRLLREFSGEDAIAARYGGEEFAILFQNIDGKEAVKRMEKILLLFSDSGFPGLGGEKVTFSCGIVEHKNGQTSHEFFNRADKAMYHAKRLGKNNVLFERRTDY